MIENLNKSNLEIKKLRKRSVNFKYKSINFLHQLSEVSFGY